RDQSLIKKDRDLELLKKKIAERKDLLDKKLKDAEALVLQQTQRLHEVSGLSREQAERALLERLETELATAMADRIRRFEEALQATVEEKAQRILATAIHPSRIEEVVKETQAEMEKHVLDVGRRAAQDVGVVQLNEKLMQLLGRLKFRTSYSQNVLLHSLEVAHLCGMIADELGLDGTL